MQCGQQHSFRMIHVTVSVVGEALATIAKYLLSSSTVKSAEFQESLENPPFSYGIIPTQRFYQDKLIRGIFNNPDSQYYGTSYVPPQLYFYSVHNGLQFS